MIVKDLVLVGGGHSHVIVLRKLGMQPVPGLAVTLVSDGTRTPYSGMLPGLVAGHYGEDDIHIDLGPLCRYAGARFVNARVSSIDTANNRVEIHGRPPIAYDALSLDIGITPSLAPIPGAREGAIAVKPIKDFLAKWNAFLDYARGGEVRSVGFIGAGAGGVELCLAVHHRLTREVWGRSIEFHLFSDSNSVLPGYPDSVQQRFETHLRERGIALHTGFRVISIDDKTLMSAEGQQANVDEVFAVTQAAPQAWLKDTGLDLDDDGFIAVHPTLQSTNVPNVFAAGDTASVQGHPRPKAGVFAVRQGPALHRNLTRFLLDRKPRAFRPQREYLSLITTGDQYAVASRGRFSTEGRWVWWWKDWIDQRFMDRFNELPAMKADRRTGLLAEFDEQMMCGGCGSKVSADLLRGVLADVGVEAVDLDDAALVEVPPGKVMLQTVDGFRAFIEDPYRFAKITVNHALSDIYAMGGTPTTALAMITLPYATPRKTRELLEQVLRGATEQLTTEGVSLAGGHTSEGMELSLGFAVTGIAEPGEVRRKGGLRAGDALILTRPLGTGALFAADMQAKARGEWIEDAIDGMLTSNRRAAEILVAAGASGMTDITGFGLAGHLAEMLDASAASAKLDLVSIPALPGALDVMADGIRSTLHEGNRRSVDSIDTSRDERMDLLFDPQTAGGLLAGVAAGDADAVLAELRSAGYRDAAIIGEVVARGTLKIVFG